MEVLRRVSAQRVVGVAVALSAVLIAVAVRPRFKEAKKKLRKRGIVMQSIFTLRDLVRAIGLSFESRAVRNTVLAAAAMTYAARALGLAPGASRRWAPQVLTFVGVNYGLYYMIQVVEVPVVMFHRTFWNVSIVEKAKLNRRSFYPVPWMTNRHLQTVVGSVLADMVWLLRRPVEFEREEVPAMDGNLLFLDWYINPDYESLLHSYGDGLTVQPLPRTTASLTSLASIASDSSISSASPAEPSGFASSPARPFSALSRSSSPTHALSSPHRAAPRSELRNLSPRRHPSFEEAPTGSLAGSSLVRISRSNSFQHVPFFHEFEPLPSPVDLRGDEARTVAAAAESLWKDGARGVRHGHPIADASVRHRVGTMSPQTGGAGREEGVRKEGEEHPEEDEDKGKGQARKKEVDQGSAMEKEGEEEKEKEAEEDGGLPEDAPVLLVLHGIGGSRDDPYVKRLIVSAAARAWRPVVYSYWRLEWLDTKDMETVVNHIADRYPRAPIFAVAFSAGGHVLAAYLAAAGRSTPLVAAASVGGCFDFVRTFDFVEQTQSPMYKRILNFNMAKCVERHVAEDIRLQSVRELFVPVRRCSRANVMYDRHIALLPEFTGMRQRHRHSQDHSWVRVASSDADKQGVGTSQSPGAGDESIGADTAEPYCAAGTTVVPGRRPEDRVRDPEWWRGINGSNAFDCLYPLPATQGHYRYPARKLVDRIAITTLILHSRDDPIVSHDDCYDWNLIARNKHLISVRTNRGGHLGWFDGAFPAWSVATFADRLVIDFFSAVLEQHAQTNFLVGVMQHALRHPSALGGAGPAAPSPAHGSTPPSSSRSPRPPALSMSAPSSPPPPPPPPPPPRFIPPGAFARICSTADLSLPTASVAPLAKGDLSTSANNLNRALNDHSPEVSTSPAVSTSSSSSSSSSTPDSGASTSDTWPRMARPTVRPPAFQALRRDSWQTSGADPAAGRTASKRGWYSQGREPDGRAPQKQESFYIAGDAASSDEDMARSPFRF